MYVTVGQILLAVGQTAVEIWRCNGFNMSAVRHIGCLKIRNFNGRYLSGSDERHSSSSSQISWRSVKPIYGDFSFL